MDPSVVRFVAIPVLVQAAHIRPVAENGSDWDGNGIWLCQNHHSLFDAGIWSIRPGDLAVVPAAGYDLSSLLMDKSDLKHLSATPFPDALEWRWEWFQKRANADTSVACQRSIQSRGVGDSGVFPPHQISPTRNQEKDWCESSLAIWGS